MSLSVGDGPGKPGDKMLRGPGSKAGLDNPLTEEQKRIILQDLYLLILMDLPAENLRIKLGTNSPF